LKLWRHSVARGRKVDRQVQNVHSLIEHHDTIGKGQGFLHIMCDQEGCRAVLGSHLGEQVLHFQSVESVESAEGFIEKK
jgi:hypothetical protein